MIQRWSPMFNKWGLILAALASAIATGVIAWALHSLNVSKINEKHKTELAAQETRLKNECKNLQQITQDVDNGLNQNLSAINGKLSTGVMLTPACTVVYASNSTGSDHGTGGAGPAGHVGLSTQWLREKVAAPGSIYRA